MKRAAIFWGITASALLLASCADPQPAGIPEELREIMRANREIAIPPRHPGLGAALQSFMTPNLTEETDARIAAILAQQPVNWNTFRQIGMRAVSGTTHLNALLSREDLAEDVCFLFDLLRYGYVAYQYFGGDEVFLPLRDSMLEQLADRSEPLQVSAFLHQILAPAFRGAIADNHFQIHNITFGATSYIARMNNDFVIRRSGDGFATEIDGASYRILETALRCGTPVDAILPTLTEEGEFAFAFGRLTAANDPDAWEIAVLLECAETGEARSRAVSLAQLSGYHPPGGLSRDWRPTVREAGGATIMANRSFSLPDIDTTSAQQELFRLGRELSDRPVLILDLRGHAGGVIGLGAAWLNGYVGVGQRLNHRSALFENLRLRSATQAELLRQWHPDAARQILSPAWVETSRFSPPSALISNENLVIVLIDRQVSSAGDLFVGYLRQLENALFVGTNTHGNFFAAYFVRTILPRSGLDVIFGTELSVRPDLSQFEGVGFLPDLWVPPGESLERALRFIERYFSAANLP